MRSNLKPIKIMAFVFVAMFIMGSIFIQPITANAGTTKTTTKNSTKVTNNTKVTINNETYTITNKFSKNDIPEDFTQGFVTYQGKQYTGLNFNNGSLALLYLVGDNSKSSGKFYIVDNNNNAFYPYVKISCDSNYIILLNAPSNSKVPDGYEKKQLPVSDSLSIAAYQYTASTTNSSTDDESLDSTENEVQTTETSKKLAVIENFFQPTNVYAAETAKKTQSTESTNGAAVPDATTNTDMSAYYLVYAIDAKGNIGWYQYDTKEGTYQRYVNTLSSVKEQEQKYQSLQKKYDALQTASDSKTALLQKIMIVAAFVGLFILFILFNLIIKVRHLKSDIRDLEEYGLNIDSDVEEADYLSEFAINKEDDYEIHIDKEQVKVLAQDVKKKKDKFPTESSILKALDDEDMDMLDFNRN